MEKRVPKTEKGTAGLSCKDLGRIEVFKKRCVMFVSEGGGEYRKADDEGKE